MAMENHPIASMISPPEGKRLNVSPDPENNIGDHHLTCVGWK